MGGGVGTQPIHFQFCSLEKFSQNYNRPVIFQQITTGVCGSVNKMLNKAAEILDLEAVSLVTVERVR